MPDLRPISRRGLWLQRLSDEVFRGIVARIRSGELVPGDPLPSHNALMAEFVTSDGVVDRAVEKLMADGVVSVGPDGALRIAGLPAPVDFEIPQSEDATLADVIAVLELRNGVDSQAAALAAARRTDAQLAAIRGAAKAFEEASRSQSNPAQADFQFHRAISEASGNRYILELTEYLGPLLIPRMRVSIAPEVLDDEINLGNAVAEHRAIVDAIERGDGPEASRAMRRHLDRTLALMQDLDGRS